MANTFRFKEGDTWPPLTCTLLDADREPVPLSGAQVLLRVSDRHTQQHVMTVQGVILDGLLARVRYGWERSLAVGSYSADWLAIFSDGKHSSFPNDEEFFIEVLHKP